jgi:hypothetical protein
MAAPAGPVLVSPAAPLEVAAPPAPPFEPVVFDPPPDGGPLEEELEQAAPAVKRTAPRVKTRRSIIASIQIAP